MPGKSIYLPEDVYRRLAEAKREGERFGDVINRLLAGPFLSEFGGAWSDETAERASEAARDGRERFEQKLGRFYG